MNAKEKHTINQTFSLPEDLVAEFHKFVKNMERSSYVAELIRRDIEMKKESLKEQYIAMGKDQGQQEVMKEWDSTSEDGLSDENW